MWKWKVCWEDVDVDVLGSVLLCLGFLGKDVYERFWDKGEMLN